MAKTAGQAATDSITSFQAIVDSVQDKQPNLYTQRDALKAQILALNLQLNDINAQITAAETDDVKKARASIRALNAISSEQGGWLLREFGGQ